MLKYFLIAATTFTWIALTFGFKQMQIALFVEQAFQVTHNFQ